jgi:calcium-binding protein CML
LPLYTGQYEDEEIRYAFRKYDKNNNGYVTVSELKKVLSKLGHKFSTKEIKNFVASVDTNKDGKLSYEGNFLRLSCNFSFIINY